MPGGTILSILSGRANWTWIRCDHITCGCGCFRIRKEKVADSKISGYVWTGPKLASELLKIQCTRIQAPRRWQSVSCYIKTIIQTFSIWTQSIIWVTKWNVCKTEFNVEFRREIHHDPKNFRIFLHWKHCFCSDKDKEKSFSERGLSEISRGRGCVEIFS